MNSILRFVSSFLTDGLPYLIIVMPLYLSGRILYRKIQQKQQGRKTDLCREFVLVLLTAYLTMLFVQTWVVDTGGTNEINLIPFSVIEVQIADMYRSEANYSLFMLNILGNIAVFVPIGMMTAYLYKLDLKKCMFTGFLISLIIEVVQLPLNRTSDVDDLILNTTGAAAGYFLYHIFNKLTAKNLCRFRK